MALIIRAPNTGLQQPIIAANRQPINDRMIGLLYWFSFLEKIDFYFFLSNTSAIIASVFASLILSFSSASLILAFSYR